MEFVRKKLRGQNQKVRRTWLSEESYRIIWRKEAWGIELPPAFQATVRVVLPQGNEMWDFVGRPLYKTMKAAQEACQKHQRLWSKAIEATGVRALQELFGKIPSGCPVWAKPKLNRKLYGLLMDNHAGKRCELDLESPTKTSACSAGPTGVIATAPGRASLAEEPDSLTTGLAESVTAAEEEPRRRASRRTVKSSKPTGKPRQSTKRSPNGGRKPSASSTKKKSKRSRS